MAGSPVALRLEHVGIVTQDLRRARHFYCVLLGLRELRAWKTDNPPGDFVMLEAGNALVELLAFRDAKPTVIPAHEYTRVGLRHLTFVVANLEDTWAQISAEGYRLIIPIRPGNYYRRFLFFEGPDDVLIELVED